MTAPINTNIDGDIQSALNTSYNGDLGYTIERAAYYNRINKWAKYKPIVHTATGYLTAAQRRDANQGFHVSTASTYDAESLYQQSATNCWNAANASGADWTYDKAPTGTIGTSPYRIFDLLYIETDLSQISTSSGYRALASCPYTLVSVGVYPNTGTVANTVDCACAFYYFDADLSMSDFGVYYNTLGSYDWYYCLVAKVPGNSGNVSVIPLMTEVRGSTKLAVGTPSTNIKAGYFTLPLNQQTTGTVQAFLAIYGVNKTTQTGDSNFIFLPVGRNANFDISAANPSAELAYVWTNIQDPRQPSPAVQGIRITAYQTQSTDIGYAITSVQLRIMIGIPSTYSASSKFTVKLTPKIVGMYNSSEIGSASNTVSYEIDPNNLPANNVAYLDVSLVGSTPIPSETVDSAKISIRAQFGAENPFYLDPIHTITTSMAHGGSAELFQTIGAINTALGSNYVSTNIIQA